MNTSKTKYIVPFALIFLLGIYQALLSFNYLPFVMGSEDIQVALFILIALYLLILSLDVQRVIRRTHDLKENIEIKLNPEKLEEIPYSESINNGNLCKFLIGIQNFFKKADSVDDALKKLLVAASRITHSGRASIMLHDVKKDELYIYKTLGWKSTEIRFVKNMRSKPGEGIAGRVFLDEKPLSVSGDEIADGMDFKEKYKTESFISLPLYSGSRVFGVINLTEKRDGPYGSNEKDILTFITNEVALKLPCLKAPSEKL